LTSSVTTKVQACEDCKYVGLPLMAEPRWLKFSWRYQSRAQSLRKLLLDLLCPGCPIADLVITTIGICFATGQARQVSAIAPHPNFCRGRCVLLLQFFAFRTTTRHAPLPIYTQMLLFALL